MAVVATGMTGAVAPAARAETGPPPDAVERTVLTHEHVDAINVGLDGSQLTVNSKVGPPTEFHDTDELVYHLSDHGRVDGLPPEFAEFIGAETAWLVPQSQNPEVVWAGWSTEGIGAGQVDGDAVDITLTDVRGPGEVEVFQSGVFGEPIRIFSSDEDYKTLHQQVNAHVHANWTFTEPGVYTLTFEVAAMVGGAAVTSGPVDYTWVVGGLPGALPSPAPSTTELTAPATAAPGAEVALEASVTTDTGENAPPAPGGYVEFRSGDESLGWSALTDGTARLTHTFAEAGEYPVTATYVTQEPQFYAGSTSEPVVVEVAEELPTTTLTIFGPPTVDDGAEVTLTAGQDPTTELEHYHWFAKAPGAAEFAVVDGAVTHFLTFTAEAAADGTQYQAALYTDDDVEVARSAPYTLTVEDGSDVCEGDQRTVLNDEHVDLVSPRLTGTELVLEAKVGSANDHTFYAPADVLMQVKDPEAAAVIPDDELYAFVGEPGAPAWVIPQTQNPEIVWAGWSTEELALGAFRDDVVHYTLVGADGPGELEVFWDDQAGIPRRIFSSDESLEPWVQAVPLHSHANWAFTALGEYTVTFEVSGTLVDGTEVSSGPVDYAVVVGDIECDPGGNESGNDDGTETGAENGAAENGADENGADENGAEAGDVSGGDAGGEDGADGGTDAGSDDGSDAGADDGTDPTPTTTPTGEVCVAPTSTSSPSASASSPSGTAAPAGDPVVLTTEHVDLLTPQLDGSELTLAAKVGSANDHTFHDPADVLVQLGASAASTVPAGDAYAFLGAAGDPMWLIPQTQNPDVVWAGWSTEELAAGELAGDTVDITLVSVDGPGELEVFQNTGFGAVSRVFSSADPLPARAQSVGQHVHANWAFSAEGSYTLTFQVTGTLTGGTAVSTGPVDYTFEVGAATPSATPTPTATPTPSATGTADDDPEDCALPGTGSAGLTGAAVLGGLLVAGGAVAAVLERRRRGVHAAG